MKWLGSPNLVTKFKVLFTGPEVFCLQNRASILLSQRERIPRLLEPLAMSLHAQISQAPALDNRESPSGASCGRERTLESPSGHPSAPGSSGDSEGRHRLEKNEQRRQNPCQSKNSGLEEKGGKTGDGFDRSAFARLFKSERKYPNSEVRQARMRHGRKRAQAGEKKTADGGCSNVDVHQNQEVKSKVKQPGKEKKPKGRKGNIGYIDGIEGQVTELGLGSGCFVGYWKGVFKDQEAIMNALGREAEWMDKEVIIFGKKHMQPRRIAYMADDEDLTYTYSKLRLIPKIYTSTVRMIKEHLEQQGFGGEPLSFNCVLLNYYRNGLDHMGWHADDEPLFGDNPTIGSVSFGVERDFILRSISDSTVKYLYKLGDGDVLVMSGATQKYFKHCIPKRSTVSAGRINLTFRKIVKKEADPVPT